MLDLNAHYRLVDGPKIAWYLLGYELKADEDTEWTGIMQENKDRVRAVMVGDDRVHIIDVDELEAIKETDFCRDCGQIGCKCEVWE